LQSSKAGSTTVLKVRSTHRRKWVMKRIAGVLGIGMLVLAMVATGCKTTPRTGRGKLCIDAYGKGARDTTAEVFVNGSKECDVSMAKGKGFFLFLPAGEHMVKVQAEGFATVEKKVKIRPNETTWTNIRMKPPKPAKAKPEAKGEEKAKEPPAGT
jgi:hypothetical protein